MFTRPQNRHSFARLAAFAMFLSGAGLVALSAQPPGEVEDPKAKTVKKKVIVDDDPVPGKKPPAPPSGNTPDVKLDELVGAAEEARIPALKALFTKHMVPFDQITQKGGVLAVKPVPVRKPEWPPAVRLTPLDATGKAKEDIGVKSSEVSKVDHFETIVQSEADALLKQKGDAAMAVENAAAAEQLLAAALRYHDYAREKNIRKGKSWDEVRDPLKAKLRDVRMELLRTAIAANDAARIRDASTKLMNAYPKDAEVAAGVAVARAGEAERLLKTGSHADAIQAKSLIDDFENRFPGAGGDGVKKIRAQLKEIALAAFTRAKEKKAVGDTTTARDELARAAALDSSIEGIREMQRELRSGYPILYVGVRQYPVNLSPATARLDSEKQVVELLFEGLLEEVPEENGSVHYRPGAALAMPTAVPGGRELLIRTFDRDPTGRFGFDSHDVVGTMKMLGNRPDSWQAYPLAWLGGLPAPKDSSAIQMPFALGHPDPRAALTFKLLPARWLSQNGKGPEDPGFAEKPLGTGPFRLHSGSPTDGVGPREMVFVDDAVYGRWRDRTGLPRIREVRLVETTRFDTLKSSVVQTLDPVAAFRDDKLHILADIPTQDIEKFSGLAGKVDVVTAAVNRRVHILAVNLNRPNLQSKDLRQGLSMAIDREDILRTVFRAGRPEFHKPMTGPFPPNSWASPQGQGAAVPLMNRDSAVDRLRRYVADPGAKTELELLFAKDDPRAEEACQKIKKSVEDITKDALGGRKLTVNIVGISMQDLLQRVQVEHRYELAYVPFDYPDDWYPYALGAALDPLAATRGGRNWFSFMAKDTNFDVEDKRLTDTLNELRGFRDFVGQLAPRTIAAGKLFNERLPFIPLWQLDRHTVVHKNLKVSVDDTAEPASPRLLNPTTLFQGVARWRLE